MSHNYIYGSFSRLSDFPLDDRYLFETKELLNKYLIKTGKITTTAYEGQLVYVIEDESLYLIQKKDNGELYPQIITSERYDDADIRDEIDKIKAELGKGKYKQFEDDGGIAFGIYTVARDYRFAVGEYNIDDKNALFIVGNGTEAERNNAFTVNKDGTATVSSDPKKDTDVATKKYVDEKVSNVDVDLTDYVTKDDLNNAVDGLVDIETLNNTVKDLATKDNIPDISGLATKEEFGGLSEKVERLDTDIDGLVEDLNVQNDAIVSLSDRVSNIENATPEIPENVVDEDRLTEVLKDYTTKNDLTDAISKISTLNKKIIEGVSGNKVIIDGVEREPDSNTIYLLKDNISTGPDIYKEYTLIDGELTLIGDTSTSLTGLATTEYVDSKIDSIDIPVNVSDLVNDTGYITAADVSVKNTYLYTIGTPTYGPGSSAVELTPELIEFVDRYIANEPVNLYVTYFGTTFPTVIRYFNTYADGSNPSFIIEFSHVVADFSYSDGVSNGTGACIKDYYIVISRNDDNTSWSSAFFTNRGDTYLPEHKTVLQLIDEEINNIKIPETDLSNYYNKTETENLIAEAIKDIEHPTVDLTDYATKEWVGEQGYLTELPEHTHDQYLTEHQDLTDYATKTFVSEKIAEAQLADKEIDLSAYATKEDIKDLATESFVNDAISSIEIPDTSSFITMADVEEKGYITEHQSLEGYATEEWVGEQGYLTELPEHTHDQYLTEHQDISGKLDVSVYNTEKETFLTEDDISNVATKDDLTSITNNIDSISKKVDSQQEVINKFFTGNAQEAYDELSEIGAAIVELRDQVIDENIAGALVDKVIDIEKTRYTKTEVDNLLEDKANKEHSHDEYTTETDVNNLIDAKLGQVSIDSIDPSKVVFPEEVKTTYSIGKITVSNNTPTTLIKAGGTLKDFFNIFIDETIGTVTQPSISSLSMSGNNAYYEVGYTLSKPKLSFTFNDGNYKYGPEPTGVKLTSIAATYNGVDKTHSDFTVSGNNYSVTFDDVVISKEGDICNLTNLDIGYSAGNKPITNLGNESDTGAISAGTLANKHSGISSCKGYWPLFYKNVTETKNDDGTFDRLVITADNIRSKLTKSDLKSKTAFSITIGDGSTSVIIAVPSSWGEIKSIKDVQANADVLSGFSVSDLEINGYNENTNYKQTYKLYVFNSAGLGSTTYNVSF